MTTLADIISHIRKEGFNSVEVGRLLRLLGITLSEIAAYKDYLEADFVALLVVGAEVWERRENEGKRAILGQIEAVCVAANDGSPYRNKYTLLSTYKKEFSQLRSSGILDQNNQVVKTPANTNKQGKIYLSFLAYIAAWVESRGDFSLEAYNSEGFCDLWEVSSTSLAEALRRIRYTEGRTNGYGVKEFWQKIGQTLHKTREAPKI